MSPNPHMETLTGSAGQRPARCTHRFAIGVEFSVHDARHRVQSRGRAAGKGVNTVQISLLQVRQSPQTLLLSDSGDSLQKYIHTHIYINLYTV